MSNKGHINFYFNRVTHVEEEEDLIVKMVNSHPRVVPVTVKNPVGRPKKRPFADIVEVSNEPTSQSLRVSQQSAPMVGYKVSHIDWLGNPIHAQWILSAVRKHQGSWQAAVNDLQQSYAPIFDNLRKNTVCGWFMRSPDDGTTWVWRPGPAMRVEQAQPREWYRGPIPFVALYPAGVQAACEAIAEARSTGIPVNATCVAPLLKSLFDRLHRGHQVNFSERFARGFLSEVAGLSYRRATSAAQKLPADWQQQGDTLVKKIAQIAARHCIRPRLIINSDQTGIILVPAANYSFDDVKATNVKVIGQEEKRAITAVVSSSFDGQLLPLQLVFGGQDKNMLIKRAVPSINDPHVREAVERHHFHLTQTPSHWSTLGTMQEFVEKILTPYWCANKIDDNDHLIWLIDSWVVHRSQEFVRYCQRFPWLHVVLVPANCTSVLQPADVGLQRPFKARFREEFHRHMFAQVAQRLSDGAPIKDWLMTDSIVDLKKLAVKWITVAWLAIKERSELVRSAWTRCHGFSRLNDPAFIASQRNTVLSSAVPVSDPDPRSAGDREEEDVDNNVIDVPVDELSALMSRTQLLSQ